MPDARPRPAATIVKHSLTIAGHRTSVSLEDAFWRRLGDIATNHGVSLPALVGMIDTGRGEANLSSAIRVFVLQETMREGGGDRGASGA